MSRIEGVQPDQVEPAESEVFAAQQRKWGAAFEPSLILARRPSILHAFQGMYGGLHKSGLLPAAMVAMLNRRVASIIGCEF